MLNFKDMVNGLVQDAVNEVRLETALTNTQYHKSIDKMADTYNFMNRTIESTYVNVLSGYESKFMDKNNFRFAHKTYHKSQREDNSTEYFDYLLASQGIESHTKERKVVKETYDFWFTGLQDKLPWKKVAKKTEPTTATIKKHKSLPQNSYLKSLPTTSSTTDYNPTSTQTQSFKVVGYRIYKKAIVLDVVNAEKNRITKYYDEILEKGIDRNVYLDVDSRNEGMISHLVFKYEPFGRDGKPNPYDGIKQLREFLHAQKFIASQGFVRIKEVLDFIIGYTLDFPNVIPYNYQPKSDLFTVYSVFGDFTDFEREFSEQTPQDYIPISDYFERDEDSESPDVIEKDFRIKYNPILTYDCHKEFIEPLTLEYSHINAIFGDKEVSASYIEIPQNKKKADKDINESLLYNHINAIFD